MKNAIRKILIAGLFAAMMMPQMFALAAGTKDDLVNMSDDVNSQKNKLKQLQNNIGLYSKKIDEARKKSVSLQNEISIIDDNIVKTGLEVEEISARIDGLNEDILNISKDIADTEKNINLQKDMIAYYLRELQRLGDKSPLQVILLNKSFSDFFNEIQYMEDIQNNLNKSIADLKKTQADLAAKQEDLKNKKEENLKLKDDLENKKVRLESQKVAKTVIIGQAFASENKFQALLLDAKKESDNLDADIKRMEGEIRAKLQKNDLFPYGQSVVFTWPVKKNAITAYFHDPDYPFRYVYEHPGIDIKAGQGTPVQAPAPGYVLKLRKSTTWQTYSYVVLVHAGGFSTVYIHLSNIYVKPDTYVSRGQVIGLSGGTPRTVGAGLFTTGPHLHFETRLNGIPVNPLDYLVNL
jgi:murein DD-endopeptidase MepM/ murein hydrolase activator NlpD